MLDWVVEEHEEDATLIAPTSIHVERFTGCISGWSILNNDWSIQTVSLLTSIG